jgi:pimeloyl-ACP methyl ester carboxylesterase
MPAATATVPRAGAVRYLLAGAFRWMAFVEWGDPEAPPLICVHGLTRNGRDFDTLAEALSDRYRVICPDLPGRGRSDWLGDSSLYQPPSYIAALSHLLAAIGKPVGFVGTSLGGICGMLIAAAHGQPITRIVVNDVGPHIPAAALRRIRAYMAPGSGGIPAMTEFADMAALQRHLELVHAPFGELTEAEWARLARHSGRTLRNGRIALHFDPAIGDPILAAEPQDVDLWPVWAAITIPVLVLRGANSDLLLPETLERMRARPGTEAHIVPAAGHAPALMDAPTIDAIASFLAA